MKYKMVVIDLDDTLLQSNKAISVKSAGLLKEIADKGIKVILASGRTVESACYYMEQLGLDFPVIGFQGACIYDCKSKKMLSEKLIDQKAALPIIKHIESLGIHCNVYSEDKVYIKESNEWSNFYKEIFINNSVMLEVGKLSEFIKFPMIKILMADDNKVLLKVKPEMEEVAGSDINVFFSQPYFLEFTHKYATKGHALKELSESYGIKREEIIAIGDSYNDISMLEYAGLGICMGNGPEDVKKIADYVTLGNDEGGVAHVIEKFILKNNLKITV